MANSGEKDGQVSNETTPGSYGLVLNFNFWEENCYKTTVKRMEDGVKLCEDFMKMVSERAEIEALYCNKMKTWSKKWEECHKKGPEYGALKTAMFGIMVEGDQLADVHFELREKLMNDVHQTVNQWKKDNYHKSLMSYKKVKNVEEGFSKAQKPWVRRLEEVNKTKKTYYNSCRNLDNGKLQQLDGKTKQLNEEQMKKLQEKVEKFSEEVKDCKMKYEDALRDITGYVPKYQADMKYQFDKCQEFEELRKQFFESLLLRYHKAVTREEYSSRMSTIYQYLLQTLKKTDTKQDLDWYASIYGTDVKLDIPEYEEYDPNMNNQSSAANVQDSNCKDENASPKKSKSGVCTTL